MNLSRGAGATLLMLLIFTGMAEVPSPLRAQESTGNEDLFEAAGCQYVVEWVENGVWSAILGGRRVGLSPPGDAMADLLLEAFACERLAPVFRQYLDTHLEGTVKEEAIDFFTGHTGHRAALTWADLAFVSSGAKIRRYLETGDPLTEARIQLLLQVRRLTHFSEIRWAVMTEPVMGLVRGLAARDGQDPDEAEEAMRDNWSMGIDYFWADLEASSLASTAYQYRNLTDDELRTFLDFAESKAGKAYYRAFVLGVQETLTSIATFLEQELPQRLPAKTESGL